MGKVPKYGDSDYMPWINKTLAQREIKKLHRKIRSLNNELEKCREKRKKQLEFEWAFRRFLTRFENRKWDSSWPIERFKESFHYLKEALP